MANPANTARIRIRTKRKKARERGTYKANIDRSSSSRNFPPRPKLHCYHALLSPLLAMASPSQHTRISHYRIHLIAREPDILRRNGQGGGICRRILGGKVESLRRCVVLCGTVGRSKVRPGRRTASNPRGGPRQAAHLINASPTDNTLLSRSNIRQMQPFCVSVPPFLRKICE